MGKQAIQIQLSDLNPTLLSVAIVLDLVWGGLIWETLLLVRSKEKEVCLILGCNSKLQTQGSSLHLYKNFDMRTSRGV